MALIEIDEVSKIFGFGDATTLALDEVSLSVEKGEFLAVMGPSGSGKTTLMNIIGLLDKPSHGNFKLNGALASRLRAAIARALINKPSIIIADEPTGNLDSHDSRVVMELFAEIHRQGNTILLVTHNPELTRYANRVIYMYDGTIVGDERTAIGEMAKHARRIYFRKPRTTDDDLAAGVSALLKDIPGQEITAKTKKRKPRGKKRSIRRKARR
jgi:ABC-type lipoprotein export system ATPase subunit